jgi:L-amino acid N-acyltransferase YncA
VHRICFSDQFRGQALTKVLFSNIFTLMNARGYRDFRVDTHELNQIMQHVFEREGFVRRGIVQIDGERIAYQREL